MTQRFFRFFYSLSLLALGLSSGAFGNSHARIVRLSLVQGDVRFAPSFRDDSLTDLNAGWQTAPVNLPIRQGYVLATDNGRAEVEFENGAMVFLGPNTVIEFYDLSLQDGDRITRLVLRQGTATVYVNPGGGDYFSVTGGDFSVEAAGRTTFRLDNFDDGSTVNVEQGHANVLRDKKSTPLEKGQSLSMHANDSGDFVIGRTADLDDFDHWVSGRIDSVVTATNYSSQYVNSPGYTSGFGDLYTYGSWYPLAGYGYGWRPFGMGLGWSPFDYGGWYQDPFFGLTFIGYQPWGWLPYHYGGWVFSPNYGWVWVPVGFGGYAGAVPYRPVTAVWVRNGASLGMVPLHPTDKFGKTAQNLNQGIYTVQNSQIARTSVAGEKGSWSVVKQAPTQIAASPVVITTPPARVSRAIPAGSFTSNRMVISGRESSISYDPIEHRYVNSGNPPPTQQTEVPSEMNRRANREASVERGGAVQNSPKSPAQSSGASAVILGSNKTPEPPKPAAPPTPPPAPRATTPPRPPVPPPPAHSANSASSGNSSSHGSSSWGGGSGGGSSSHSSSGGGSWHSSSSGGSGGGHPH